MKRILGWFSSRKTLERELEGKQTLLARLSPQVEALGTENAQLKQNLETLWPDLVLKKKQLVRAHLELKVLKAKLKAKGRETKRRSRDEVALALLEGLKRLPATSAKLFIRRKNFEVVGLLVGTSNRMDVASGNFRTWGIIRDFDLKLIEEPLDRKNRRGKIESCVLRESSQLLITARNSPDIRDDADNFTWWVMK